MGKLTGLFFVTTALLPASIIYGPGSGGNIPDALPDGTPQSLVSDIVVANSGLQVGAGDAITVDLYGLVHTYSGDLSVTLTHLDPTGTVTLTSGTVFYRIGKTDPADPNDYGYDAEFGDSYHFNSGFSNNLWTVAAGLGSADVIPGDALGEGDYTTNDPYSSASNNFSSLFAGESLDGIWELTVTDNSPGDTGSLDYWTLTVGSSVSLTPEPASLALVSSALVGLVGWKKRNRRRARELSLLPR